MNREKINACGITGLRSFKLKWGRNENDTDCIKLKEILKDVILENISIGVTNFYTGMAIGTDIYYAKIILELKNTYSNIKLIAVIPFKGQHKRWSQFEQEEYALIMKKCDDVICLQSEYTSDCYFKRNEFIVNRCDLLIAVTDRVDKAKSGTAQTIRYAIAQNKVITIINPHNFNMLTI